MSGIDLKSGKNGAAPVIRLNSGYDLPAVGLGTYALHGSTCTNAVIAALKSGYRLIDTASFYGNEREVGEGVRRSGVAREEIFVQTKLYPNQYSHAERAIDEALEKLDTDWLVCGHTHRQGIFRWQGRTLINPGAVHWRNTACCALLTGTADGWTAELLTLPYDTGAYARQVLQSGMAPMAPVWTQVVAEELRTGGDLLEPWIAGSIAGVKQKGLTDAREVFGCWYRQAEELGVPLPPLEEMLAACLST